VNRPTVWPWVRPFLILLVVIAIPPLVYWFGYVHSRTADERRLAYSTLSAITADFRNRLIAYDKIAKSTDDYAPQGHPYLAAYLSSILKTQYKELPAVNNDAANRLKVQPETGDLLLLAKDGSDGGAVHAAAVALNTLLAWEIVRTQFDGLLLVAPENQLVAQDRRLPEQPLGQQVALQLRKDNPAFAEFLARKGVGAAPAQRATPSPSSPGTWDPLSPDFSEDGSIQLGGVDYVAFLQIVSAPVSSRTAANGTSEPHARLSFMVCGLISRDRLNRSVFQLHPLTLVAIASLLLFCLFVIPFLKLRFIGERERMRHRDVWLLAGSILSATALATLAVFTWRTVGEVGTEFDTALAAFTRNVAGHLETESKWAYQELTSSAPRLLGKMADDAARMRSSDPVGSILTQETFTSYPDFEAIATTDIGGRQLHKWMTRTLPTPNIDTGEQPHFAPALAQTQSPSNNAPYVFHTTLAPTSGLMLGVYAVPYAASPLMVGASAPLKQRTGVAAIAIPMLSVSSTVVARPFQFVLVDSHGAVVFQHSQGSFRDERFFETVQGGPFLQRAARAYRQDEPHGSECSECGTYQYRGKTYRMMALRIPPLQLTLVGYYDHAVVETLSARIFSSAGIFMVGIVGSILLGAVIAAWCFDNTCFDWAWPARSATPYYAFGVLLCLGSMGLLILASVLLPSEIVRWGMLLIPIPVLLILSSGKVAPAMRWCFAKIGLERLATRDYSLGSMSEWYTLFGVMMLIAFVAWPTYVIFNDALRLHMTEYARESAGSWQKAQAGWLGASEESLVNAGSQLGELDCQKGPKDLRCWAPDKLYASKENYSVVQRKRKTLAVYGICVRPDSADSQCRTELEDAAPYSLTVPVALWLSNYRNRPAEHGQTLSWINKSQPHAAAPVRWRGAPWSALDMASLLLVPMGLWLLVRSIATHVLGMQVSDEVVLDNTAALEQHDGTAWLLLRPSATLLRGFDHVRTLDLRSDPRPTHSLAPGEGTTLLVKHFEAQMSSKEWRAWVLSLLTGRWRGCILLTSEIDPVYYLAQRVRDKCEYLCTLAAGDQEKRQQTIVTCGELRNELAAWSTALRVVRKIRQPFRPLRAPENDMLAKRLAAECGVTEPLHEIGERLRARPDLGSLRWDQVVSQVLDAADPYYRCLWELCSREERLVLIQLAEAGLVNPKRQDLVRHLSRRQLVKIDPRFKLMNASFARFVRGAEPPERVLEWEAGGSGLPWSRLGTPLYALAAMVVAVLLFAEHGLVTDILAAATGSAATFGSLRNLYASFVKSPAAPSKPA